jgi:NhaP-type Na+/H+ or K+/H+ antiporter
MEPGIAIAILWVVIGGFLAQWAGARLRLPAIVLLLALGLIAGPGLGILHPSAAMGDVLRPAVGLAVAIVVFEGGLALDFRELRAAGEGVRRLTIFALPLNGLFATAAARFIGAMPWSSAALFGAIVVVTGPTVVLPLLRQARLERRIAAFLRWEAIVNDPVGAILTALILEALIIFAGAPEASAGLWTLALRLGIGVVAGAGLGIAGAFLVKLAFQRDLVPEILKTPMLLSIAMGTYALANMEMDGAGLIAATLFGVALANLGVPGLAELRRFKEALVVLLVSALFIVLAADLDRAVLARLSWPIVALTLATLFLVRPAAIFLATMRSGLTGAERLLAAWIAPRGIVAAAVASFAAIRLSEAGYAGAELIQPTVFMVIVASVVLHGFSLAPLARRLGLATENRPGLAIIGASPWAVDLADILVQHDVPVLLVDIYPGPLAAAERRGLATLRAQALSEQAADIFADKAVGYVLAATPDEVYNALTCARLAPELGRERVYQLAPKADELIHPEEGLARDWRGKVLADTSLDFATVAARYRAGWRFQTVEAEGKEASEIAPGIAVMRIGKNGTLDLASPDHEPFSEAEGARLVVFAPPDEEPAERC